MCGHFGAYNSKGLLPYTTTHVLWNMLMVGVVRGMDGTGFAAVDKNGANLRAMKVAGGPWNLFGGAVWKEFKESVDRNASMLIGHHRAATKGSVTSANAHPFHHGHITMAHNGTLTNTIPYQFDVDSDWLASQIAKSGIDAFKDVHGAYACVWWDSSNKTLNFFVNKERPLSIVKYDNVFYWASELDMLKWTLGRQFKGYDDSKLCVYELDFDTHYFIALNDQDLMKGVKVDKNPKQSYQYIPTHTKGGSSYTPTHKHSLALFPKNKQKKRKSNNVKNEDDGFAVFVLLEEEVKSNYRYLYSGITDRHELMFVETSYKVHNWEGETWEGVIKTPHIRQRKEGGTYVEYEVDPAGFWALVEEDVEIIYNNQRALADGTYIEKHLLNSLIQDGCAACGEELHAEFHEEYLPLRTDSAHTTHALICATCIENHATLSEDVVTQ